MPTTSLGGLQLFGLLLKCASYPPPCSFAMQNKECHFGAQRLQQSGQVSWTAKPVPQPACAVFSPECSVFLCLLMVKL